MSSRFHAPDLTRSCVLHGKRLLLLVAALLISSGSAWASCGDYLLHTEQPVSLLTGSQPNKQPATPCQGPGCRQQPAAPIAVPPAPVTLGNASDLFAMLDTASQHSAFVTAAAVRELAVHAVAGFPDDVLRPPISA